MLKIVIKEKFGDMVYNFIYIFLVTINMTVIFLLFLGGDLLRKIHNSSWFSEEIYLESTQDAFFAEKFKMVYNVSTVFIAVALTVLNIILLYIIISHINKWKMDMALLYTLGYKDKNMYAYLSLRNAADIVLAAAVSAIMAVIIWENLVINKLFKSILAKSSVEYKINYRIFIIICVCIFAVQMLISVLNYRRQKHKNIRNVVED